MSDRAERLEREAEARGIEAGIEQGIELGISELSEILKEGGVDAEAVDAAVAALRARAEAAE